MVNKKSIRRMIGAILMVSLLCTGCGMVKSSSKEEAIYLPVDMSLKQDKEREWLPQIEEVVPYPYYYLCYGMEDIQKQGYKKDLLTKGLKQIKQETVDDITYEYYADAKKKILLVDIGENIIVSIADVYGDMEVESDYPLETAFALIKEEYHNNLEVGTPIVTTDTPPEILIKCWIPDLYEKAKMQAYVSLTRGGREAGIYLISDDKACKISDSLENICIADIDENGTSELLSLYGFGSGIYRINLNVYQYSNPLYFNSLKKVVHCCYSNCFVPKQGYGQLAFKKVSDSKVHLVEVNYDLMEDEKSKDNSKMYGKDYGKLVIDGERINVNSENIDEFPYYIWEEWFQSNTNSDKKDTESKDTESKEIQPMSDEVPKLTVKVADTTLQNSSWKQIWGEEEESSIPFSDMMKSNTDIPRFSCPDFYEYTDEICLSFDDGIKPQTIQVQDYLITEDGKELFGKTGVIKREIRYGKDGNYYIGLMAHFALYLSSSSYTYTSPSYRGFRVICKFDEQHSCEYVFVLSVDPAWKER